MIDNPTRAKMAILNLTPDEIIEAIKLLPVPTDWREMIDHPIKDDLDRVIAAAHKCAGMEPMGPMLDTNVAAVCHKCTPEQARQLAHSIAYRHHDTLQKESYERLKEAFGARPHDPETTKMIFDNHEIP